MGLATPNQLYRLNKLGMLEIQAVSEHERITVQQADECIKASEGLLDGSLSGTHDAQAEL